MDNVKNQFHVERSEGRAVPGLTREDEEEELSKVIDVAQTNLNRTQKYITKLTDELYDLKQTYGAKDKEALAMLHNTESQLIENKQDLIRCEKARKKPYFGRIDFKDPGMPAEESYYVGRVGIAKNGSEPVVIDWRAPIASIYYENTIGPCRYVVKNEGTYEVELNRKRTYEIANDKLKDFFDSDVVANDELLTKYLAKSKKAVLGEIIATIQQEQNAIIRKSPKTNVIVQGVAGSGKTTVAMHRISYILYNYEDDFRPEDFYIVGSNRILLNYITSVLPDLDVYGVSQMTMEQLFVRLLYEDWDADRYHIHSIDKMAEEACMKGSYDWFHDLEAFCKRYEDSCISRDEIRVDKSGNLLMGQKVIDTYIANNPGLSVQGKINLLNEMLLSKLENEMQGKNVTYKANEKQALIKKYSVYFGKDEWKGNIFDMYHDFLLEQCDNQKVVPLPEDDFDVYDLAALAYLYKRIKETDGIREASHVVIDEAQDFGMMAYAALHFCLRDCTYTIMGDVSQNIHFGYGLNDWEDLKKLILTGTFDSFGLLKKSYRNTVEISNFATEILRHGDFSIYPVEPIIRHGNEVKNVECKDIRGMFAEAAACIKSWQADGHETIAVVCRNEKEAKKVFDGLKDKVVLNDCDLETAEFGTGVMVLPVDYTKGLEFDCVLIFNPSTQNYPADNGHVKLLYVAATRALHELMILHRGNLTELIAKPVSEEKRMKSLTEQQMPAVKVYEKVQLTTKEQEQQDSADGHREMEKRDYLGPKRISVEPKKPVKEVEKPKEISVEIKEDKKEVIEESIKIASKSKATNTQEVINPSLHAFAGIPDANDLRAKGHTRINAAIRWSKKAADYVDISSTYGVLRLIPISDEIIRIRFMRGQLADFPENYWDYEPQMRPKWTFKEAKDAVGLITDKLVVRIEKKTGAMQFYTKDKKLLLQEKANEPRQIELGAMPETWSYFDWGKNEKLKAKGILYTNLERLNMKARYISFGQKTMRMPLLVSDKGYGIGVAAEQGAMCCDIPMYGPYLYTDGMPYIDYYFMYGASDAGVFALYKILTEN